MPDLVPLALFLGMLIVSLVAIIHPWSSLDTRSPALLHLPLSLVAMFPAFLVLTHEPGAARADLVLLLPPVGLALICYIVKLARRRKERRSVEGRASSDSLAPIELAQELGMLAIPR